MERCNGLEQDPEGAFVYHDDAQATIAALQADNRTYINERHEHVKQIEQLQSQLTQRTAELEAAKHCYADLLAKYQNLVAWYDKQNGTPCEQVRHKQEVADLQAELERMKGREET